MPDRIDVETAILRKCGQVNFLAGVLLADPDERAEGLAIDLLADAIRLEHQRRLTCANA